MNEAAKDAEYLSAIDDGTYYYAQYEMGGFLVSIS